MIKSVADFLKMNEVEYEENRCLADYSSVGIGGRASIICFPKSKEQLCKTVDFLSDNKIRYKILGRMSNVLPSDDGYAGVAVKTDKLSAISITGNKIIADAGVPLPLLANMSAKYGLSGLEGLSGIPGSIGGAISGNAGAFGREISDILISVSCFDRVNRNIVVFRSRDCGFSYRNSFFRNGDFTILSAELGLEASNSLSVKSRINEFKKRRLKTQPVGVKSLGSTFKRTAEGISAAMLIDRCGLKGFSFGGAQISEKHAGFIVNTGSASSHDYIRVMEHARLKVSERFNIRLDEEIEIL